SSRSIFRTSRTTWGRSKRSARSPRDSRWRAASSVTRRNCAGPGTRSPSSRAQRLPVQMAGGVGRVEAQRIVTDRFELVPAALRLLEAALESASALAVRLEADVPSTWPPEYLDRAALAFTVERIRQAPTEGAWWMYFFLWRGDGASRRKLIGSGG